MLEIDDDVEIDFLRTLINLLLLIYSYQPSLLLSVSWSSAAMANDMYVCYILFIAIKGRRASIVHSEGDTGRVFFSVCRGGVCQLWPPASLWRPRASTRFIDMPREALLRAGRQGKCRARVGTHPKPSMSHLSQKCLRATNAPSPPSPLPSPQVPPPPPARVPLHLEVPPSPDNSEAERGQYPRVALHHVLP